MMNLRKWCVDALALVGILNLTCVCSLSVFAREPTNTPVVNSDVHIDVVSENGVLKTGESIGEYQAGAVDGLQRDTIEHTFMLKNNSGRAIVIDRLQASDIEMEWSWDVHDRLVLPLTFPDQGVLPIKVTIPSDGLNDGSAHDITIFAEGLSTPCARVGIVGELLPPITFKPERLDFGTLKLGEKKTIDFQVIMGVNFPNNVMSMRGLKLVSSIADLKIVRIYDPSKPALPHPKPKQKFAGKKTKKTRAEEETMRLVREGEREVARVMIADMARERRISLNEAADLYYGRDAARLPEPQYDSTRPIVYRYKVTLQAIHSAGVVRGKASFIDSLDPALSIFDKASVPVSAVVVNSAQRSKP
ncbi:MAG: hypothetical protein ABIY70_18520 [Capsulimonas sp.]|uniref:hypothetical protein n=1 Tax=Capsulimonas sp. TaxID=2494211 RepID=UPI00326690CC